MIKVSELKSHTVKLIFVENLNRYVVYDLKIWKQSPDELYFIDTLGDGYIDYKSGMYMFKWMAKIAFDQRVKKIEKRSTYKNPYGIIVRAIKSGEGAVVFEHKEF